MLPENEFHSATVSELAEAQARTKRFGTMFTKEKRQPGVTLSAQFSQEELNLVTAAADCLEFPIEKFVNEATIYYAKLVLRHR